MYSWVFAKRTDVPARLMESVPGWKYTYILPEDCLKVVSVIAPDRRADFNLDRECMLLSDYAENVELTGMFATGIPIYVKKGDTPAKIQEQLVSIMSRPVPDLDELKIGIKNPNSGVYVSLSMQTYLKSPKTPELELPFIPGMAELRNNAPNNYPTPSKMLTILVNPESSFCFEIMYDNRFVGVDLVNKLGLQFITELRHIVESHD